MNGQNENIADSSGRATATQRVQRRRGASNAGAPFHGGDTARRQVAPMLRSLRRLGNWRGDGGATAHPRGPEGFPPRG
jgi:hypothetical protein